MKSIATLLFFLTLAAFHVDAQQPPAVKDAITNLQRDIPDLMEKADIPGMSVALIHDGRVVWKGSYGVTNANTKKPVTAATVFEAASLSKCVFAYGVLKLVDEGKLNLDTPLNKYLGNDYGVTDPRINQVTARRVLSHSSGFPNWREFDRSKTLLIHFNPGEKWSYSGEGVVYLSKVVEKITGLSLEDFMQSAVLRPLGMTSSSYTWQSRFDSLKTYRHDMLGNVTGRSQKISGELEAVTEEANAAASLSTNAADYSKFLIAVLNGTGLKKATWDQMLTPQIRVTDKYPALAWGLGVGLETMPGGTWFWHWGDNGDGKAYFIASVSHRDGIVYFANGANGLGIAQIVLKDAIGSGEHPSLENLNYDRYDAPGRLLLKSILAEGAVKALDAYRQGRKGDSSRVITEEAMNGIGYDLSRLKKQDDAMEVFKQNTKDFPGSWNAWDSYAEAYMNKGDKEMAIKYYQKSLELNPGNENGKKMLEQLRGENKQ